MSYKEGGINVLVHSVFERYSDESVYNNRTLVVHIALQIWDPPDEISREITQEFQIRYLDGPFVPLENHCGGVIGLVLDTVVLFDSFGSCDERASILCSSSLLRVQTMCELTKCSSGRCPERRTELDIRVSILPCEEKRAVVFKCIHGVGRDLF